MRLCLVLSFVILNGSFCNSGRANPRRFKNSTIEYFTRPKSHITIPIIIHFDKYLTDRLVNEYRIKTRRQLKHIAKHIIRDVETNFQHPSLNQKINFLLLDTKFMTKKLEKNEDGSKYLRNYCIKQGYRKREKKIWWYSILLTGLDLFYLDRNGKEVRRSTGRGYMGGACALEKSCAVIEWSPKNIGYLLTHELGHSLGMTHDGAPHNECRPHRYIMTSKYHPQYHPKTWSRCSRRNLQRFLGSRKAWCIKKHTA